jgi:ABC-type Fe3+-hydroxamate transport system substrate-binding protein
MSDYPQADQLEVPVEHPPRRIVSLVPSMTESLFDMRLGDRLVGRTKYCVHPAGQVERVPVFGGTKNPDVAGIIALEPDLVIVNQEENRQQDAEALQAAGITVWVTFPKTVPDVFNLLWAVMNACEETTMVPRVRLIEQIYDRVLGISTQREDNPTRVFAPIWHKPLMSFNADTFMYNLLKDCGAVNVFGDREDRYPKVTLAEVEAAQPDVILLPSEPYEFAEQDIPQFAALDTPASKDQRIHLVDGSLLAWHGTRIAHTFEQIPPLLFPKGEEKD